MTTTLAELLKDSAYKLSQFKSEQISALEAAITLKETAKKPAPYVTCLVRGKPIKLTSEEAVRQLYVMVLRDDLGYPVSRMEVEHEVRGIREWQGQKFSDRSPMRARISHNIQQYTVSGI